MKVPVKIIPNERNENIKKSAFPSITITGADIFSKTPKKKEEEILPQEETPKILIREEPTLSEVRKRLKEEHVELDKLMEVTLKQEREKHERQNEKVLKILSVKDNLIEDLESKVRELEEQSENLIIENQKLKEEASSTEYMLRQTIAEHEETIKLLNEDRERLKNMEPKEYDDVLRKELESSHKRLKELAKRENSVLELIGHQDEIKHQYSESLRLKDEELKNANNKIEEIKAELTKIRESNALTIDDLKTRLKNLSEDEQSIKDKLKQFNKKYEELKETNKQYTDIHDQLISMTNQSSITTMNDCVIQVRRTIEELQSKVKELEEQLANKCETLITCQSDKEALIKELSEKVNKPCKDARQQTILNVGDLDHNIYLLEEYRKKLEVTELQIKEQTELIAQLDIQLKEKMESEEELRVKEEEYRDKIDKLQRKLIQSNKKPNETTEQDIERREELEIALIELREKAIQLEIENYKMEKTAKLELEAKEHKIKALEQVINKDIPIPYTIKDYKGDHDMEIMNLKKEVIRLRQYKELSNVLESDNEMLLMLGNKLKAKKEEVKKLKSLLVQAKFAYDTTSLQEPKINTPENIKKHYAKYVQHLSEQCLGYKQKVIDSLNTIMQLKQEFIERMVVQEKRHKQVVSKLTESNRERARTIICLNSDIKQLTQQLLTNQSYISGFKEERAKNKKYVKEIEEQYKLEQSESRVETENKELLRQVNDLKQTIEAIRDDTKEQITQQYLNAKLEVHAMKSTIIRLNTKINNLELKLYDTNSTSGKHMEVNNKLYEENSELNQELETIKKISNMQAQNIESLTKELRESKLERANEVVKYNTLLNKLKIKEEQKKEEVNGLEKYLIPTLASYMSVHIESEVPTLLKQILNNTKDNELIALSDVVEKCDHYIMNLRKRVKELEGTLEARQVNTAEGISINELSKKYLELQKRNEELELLFDSMFEANERTQLEIMINSQTAIEELKQALFQSNNQLITLSSEKYSLKEKLHEAQDQLEEKVTEMQLAKTEGKFDYKQFGGKKSINEEIDAAKVIVGRDVKELSILNARLLEEVNVLNAKNEAYAKEVNAALRRKEQIIFELRRDNNEQDIKWNRAVLKEIADRKTAEAAELNISLTKVKGENEGLRLQLRKHGKVVDVEDINKKISSLVAELHSKTLLIEQLKKTIANNTAKDNEVLSSYNTKQYDEIIEGLKSEKEKLKEQVEVAKKEAEKYKNEAEMYKDELTDINNKVLLTGNTFSISENKLPGIIDALLESKSNEIDMNIKIEELKMKIGEYEQILKNNDITVNEPLTDNSILRKRILELESKCEELRKKELISYKRQANKYTVPITGSNNEILTNSIIVLCNRLADKESSTNEINSIEKIQRAIIKALTQMLKNIKGEFQLNELPLKEDNINHLDLLQYQIERLINIVNQLKGSKVRDEELIQRIMNEIPILNQVCALVHKEHIVEDSGDNVELLSRLALSEKIKTGMANELAQLKLALSYNKKEAEQLYKAKENECNILKESNRKLNEEVMMLKKKQEMLSKKEAVNKSLDANRNIQLSKAHVEALSELKAQSEIINGKGVQINSLKNENDKLKEKIKELAAENSKALLKENKELDAKLHKEIEERKAEIASWVKEKTEMKALIEKLQKENTKLTDMENLNVKIKRKNTKLRKYHEKVKKLKEDRNKREAELKAKLEQEANKLQVLEQKLDDERKKVIKLAEDLKEAYTKLRTPIHCDVEEKEIDNLKKELNVMKIENIRLKDEINIKNKREEQLHISHDIEQKKSIVVIAELDEELKEKTKEYENTKLKLENELNKALSIIEVKYGDIELLNEKCKTLDNELRKTKQELGKEKTSFSNLNANTTKSCKKLENEISSHEQTIIKLNQDLINREEEYNKNISELRKEYEESKATSEQLIRTYEHQIKITKENFKNEYNKLLKQSKKTMTPNKKDQCDLAVDLMLQVSQKESQITTLRNELSKAKNIARTQSTTQRKTTNSEIIKDYNDVLKEKIALEIKLDKVQNTLKAVNCQLHMERERMKEEIKSKSELEKELEELRNITKMTKKGQSGLMKKHKQEVNKVLNNLDKVKANWISPEEYQRSLEERKELEAIIKSLKDELIRKTELIKQWKEKEEAKQLETEQLLNEVEQIKDDNDKFKRTMKELDRKSQLIKSLKATIEGNKILERELTEENKSLNERIKTLKAEIGQKEAALRVFRRKVLNKNEQIINDRESLESFNSENIKDVNKGRNIQRLEETNDKLHELAYNAIKNLYSDIRTLKKQHTDKDLDLEVPQEVPKDVGELEQLYERLMKEKEELKSINKN